ncbi:hypothetical protein SSX86_003697 [Deinandra increscens subsp. villosa]|uniref:RRM domain-containing protein n=1 Tax=Deinandra increscens subsp. villosa TaxID=3103831 RepID=A0AAP0H707_9ASTR
MPYQGPTNAGNWKIVLNRKNRLRHSKIASSSNLPSNVISFFVSGIPQGVTNSNLWTVFQPYGLVYEAFVVTPKNSSADRFGFVRLQGVTNYLAMEKTLNELVYWGQTKLGVKLARFDKMKNPVVLPPLPRSHTVAGLPPPPPLPTVAPMMFPGQSSSASLSFREAVAGRPSSSSSVKTIVIPNPSAWKPETSKHSALWGVCLNLNSLINAKRILAAEGTSDFEFFHVGGLDVLLAFHDAAAAATFLSKGSPSWRLVFSSLTTWEGQEIPYKRISCLKIYGVPLLARDEVTFNRIGEAFGSIVCPSDFSWNDQDVSFGRVFVNSNLRRSIDEEVSIVWRDKTFSAWVIEEPFSLWKVDEGDPEQNHEDTLSDGGSSENDLEDGEIRTFPVNFENSGRPYQTPGSQEVDLGFGDSCVRMSEKARDISHENVKSLPTFSEKVDNLNSSFDNPSGSTVDLSSVSETPSIGSLDPLLSSPLGSLEPDSLVPKPINPETPGPESIKGPLPPLHVFGPFRSSSGPLVTHLAETNSPASPMEAASSLPLPPRGSKKGRKNKVGSSLAPPLLGGFKSSFITNVRKANSSSKKSVGINNGKRHVPTDDARKPVSDISPIPFDHDSRLIAEVGDLLGFKNDASTSALPSSGVASNIGYQ